MQIKRTSNVAEHCKTNIRALSGFAQRCNDRFERAVATERAQHRYQNRTGAAENSTQVRGQAVGASIDIDIVMDVHYASYLERSEFTSFSNRVDLALAACDSDRRHLEKLAED